MFAHGRMLVVAGTIVCALALAACSSSASSASSASGTSSAASSAATSASSSQAPAPAPVPAQDDTATVELDYSAGTGYEWSYEAEPAGVIELVSRETEDLAPAGVTGGSLRDRFTFRGVQPGEVVVTFNLARDWETDEPPAETQVYAYTVTDDLQVILNPYKSDFSN